MAESRGRNINLYLRGIGKRRYGGTCPVIACLVVPEDKWELITDEEAMSFLMFARKTCIERDNLLDASLEYCSEKQYIEFAKMLS